VKGGFPYFYKLTKKIESWAQVYRELNITSVTPDLEELFEVKDTHHKKQYWLSAFPSPGQVQLIHSIKYLVDREIPPSVVEFYGLLYGVQGYAGGHATSPGISVADTIIAPVYDLNGAYVTFQVRYLSGNPKPRWRMPAGSAAQNILYGGWTVSSRTKYLWIVEGASDVWKMASYGRQAVGLFTSMASTPQLNRLRDLCISQRLEPVVCLDGDTVYVNRQGKTIDKGRDVFDELVAYGLDSHLIHLDKPEDPGSLSLERLEQLERENGVIHDR
jgi:hypothetical protein